MGRSPQALCCCDQILWRWTANGRFKAEKHKIVIVQLLRSFLRYHLSNELRKEALGWRYRLGDSVQEQVEMANRQGTAGIEGPEALTAGQRCGVGTRCDLSSGVCFALGLPAFCPLATVKNGSNLKGNSALPPREQQLVYLKWKIP